MARPLAVVTGASSGIGAEFAKQLAAGGYDLLLVARRLDRLEHLGTKLSEQYGVSVESLAADLAKEDDLARVEDRLRQEPKLGAVINNAGFGSKGYFWDATLESQDLMHRVHVMATMRLSHVALNRMVAQGRGALINVASVAGFSLGAGSVSYCATKAWMINFTEGLAVDLRSSGSPVRVQALCPGFTLTEFHDVMGMNRGVVPGALWMRVEDVVTESLRGLELGRVVVVPGWSYKLMRFLLWLMPPAARRALGAKSGRALGRRIPPKAPTSAVKE
jgi:uncharacterized protein